MLSEILSEFGLDPASIVEPFGSGLINTTWRITDKTTAYVLQKVNQKIFKDPRLIAKNVETISEYLQQQDPAYFFVAPVKTIAGRSVLFFEGAWYRLFPFVANSHTFNTVTGTTQAFEAARQFGLFTKKLAGFPAQNLQTTLPDFHNLSLRYRQFETACNTGNSLRIEETKDEILLLRQQAGIVATFERIITSKECKLRVTHHDTKISNVLFDEKGKGICVIDLDTLMPGYFISDVGDMLRTYLSPVSEEEKDLSKIMVRVDFFQAILEGYLQEMGTELTLEETHYFVYSGLFMIYMQALRFLTDYLNNDVYYGAAYKEQNCVRTKNQITLLKKLSAIQGRFEQIVTETAKKYL